MKKNFILGTIGIGLLLVAVFGIYFIKTHNEKANPVEINTDLKIVDIDEIARHPDRFKGSIGVNGKVIKVNEVKDLFVLGCEDACVIMPVRYKGQMPIQGSNIVVYGEIKETEEGKYIFEGEEVKAR